MEAKSGSIYLKSDDEELTRTLIVQEHLLRALLLSHLLLGFQHFSERDREIEDVTYDKEKKRVRIVFSKRE